MINIDDEFLRWNRSRHTVPQVSGVYFLYDKWRNLFYIGSTADIKTRLKQHKKSELTKFDSYVFIPVFHPIAGYSHTDLEKECIKKYSPKFNIAHNQDWLIGKHKVWFEFLRSVKSYIKVSDYCDLELYEVKVILNSFYDGGLENFSKEKVNLIEDFIINR